ncbi:sugar ABC transporter substrate-binding protein [Nonomuraea sp. K274]|uniref:Sugar ABC transporter substrate-binding protein n=1 Tax=Nonomuraea cypriaca TaxID=1187855 RepID=A0A931AJ28_9ACTN|nr:sugar ABC transporter substrate-binding protein [Nonomuraea cypriaca]MBF8191418.1 sugar ABC transporter substrate-binding protein [Nonomuraea cypriaca]
MAYWKRPWPALAVLPAVSLLVACGSEAGQTGSGSAPDSGAQLTMWVRNTAGDPAKKLVDLYNKTHQNKIKLTVIPSEAFQQKVGAAAGAKSLPDLLGADVVYSPNYVKQGIYQDITEAANSLPFKESLSQAHQQVATRDGKVYGLPLLVDSSLMIYNKDLFAQAGLDPEKPPTDFTGIYEAAKAIRGLGGKTYGFYFPGNCPGCLAYTLMPAAVAAKTPPLSQDGTRAQVDSPAIKAAADLYRKLYAEGIVPSAAKTDDGTTWTTAFNAGQIGMLPVGTFDFPDLAKTAKFKWGVAPFTAPDGSATATFVGGDVIGVSRDSEHHPQAVDFLKWSLTDQPQLEVWAKNNNLTPRFDLASNQYTAKDPARVTAIEGLRDGYTPATLPYGEIFNNANGPWLAGLRGHIFNGDATALTKAQQTIQQTIDDAQ